MDRKFTQEELWAAHQQMLDERNVEYEHARIAAEILDGLVKEQKKAAGWLPKDHTEFQCFSDRGYGVVHLPSSYALHTFLCDYDDWGTHIKFLEAAGVNMAPWEGGRYPSPKGEFDLSSHPDFPEGAPQKQFTVYIKYYNSHESGY